jgi:hypothetical protein
MSSGKLNIYVYRFKDRKIRKSRITLQIRAAGKFRNPLGGLSFEK